jgi:hypothetical protein
VYVFAYRRHKLLNMYRKHSKSLWSKDLLWHKQLYYKIEIGYYLALHLYSCQMSKSLNVYVFASRHHNLQNKHRSCSKSLWSKDLLWHKQLYYKFVMWPASHLNRTHRSQLCYRCVHIRQNGFGFRRHRLQSMHHRIQHPNYNYM